MRDSLGSEVFLRVDILSEDNFVTINLLRALAYTWSAKYLRPVPSVKPICRGI
jgi:hypothetical protein